jgi:replicative DNA helicase
MEDRMDLPSAKNANVQNAYDSNLADFTPEQAAQWLNEQDEKEALLADFYRDDPLEQKVRSDLNKDIVHALRDEHPRARLERVAKLYSLSYEGVREMAEAPAAKVLGVNLESLEFESVVKTVRWLEENVMNEGERLWRLGNLARSYKTTPKHLYRCYELDLVSREDLQPLTMKELCEQNSQSIPWLVQGWLPKASTVLFHADGGVGKTLFVYQVIKHVLDGTPWNGYLTEQESVLLVQTDEPSRICADRLSTFGIPGDAPIKVLTKFQAEHLPQLVRYVEEYQPGLIVIDSLTSINQICPFKENDTEYARPLLHLRDVANDHGCTVIVIHHSNSEGKARGTKAIHNSVSEVWKLQNGESLDERVLVVEKTRGGRSPWRYKFQFDEGGFTYTYLGEESLDNESELTMEEKIRLHLSQNPGVAYAAEELAETLSISGQHTRRLVKELWAKGLCKRMRKGRAYLYHVDESCWTVNTSQTAHHHHP